MDKFEAFKAAIEIVYRCDVQSRTTGCTDCPYCFQRKGKNVCIFSNGDSCPIDWEAYFMVRDMLKEGE